MSKPKNEDALRQAIKDYINAHDLRTAYRTTFAIGLSDIVFGVFDPPADYDPSLGLMQDGPEYRAKPVLIARMDKNGLITVEQTEHTMKYLVRQIA